MDQPLMDINPGIVVIHNPNATEMIPTVSNANSMKISQRLSFPPLRSPRPGTYFCP
jgi:hypothetical protein